MEFKDLSRKSQWIALAIMSGACAAFNGVFAKLTTTELTTSFATSIANLLGLGDGEKVVEVVVRGLFFLLNLLFNAIMWTLFTKALARGTSTTRVSILNTSANFMLTAILGFLIFSESLPPLWFLGAALLVAGNVIIGRRDEGEDKDGDLEGGERQEEGALLVGGGGDLEL
ncbi:Transmembrane protein, partial [Lachnellula subtilissima]